MENIVEAEYTVIPERTLEVIAAEIRTIDNHVCQVALTGAIEIGKRLTEAKDQIGHGNWESWCKENLNYTVSWAAKLMKLSSEYGSEDSLYLKAISNLHTCADLSISKALRLLQVPENEVEDFVENNSPLESTVKELEERIRIANTKLEQLENQTPAADQEAAKEAVAELSKQLADLESEKVKVEKKNEKLKKDLETAQEKQQQEIEAAKEQAKAEAEAAAIEASAEEMDRLRKEAEAALSAVELAEKKLAQSSNEDIVMFKAHVNSLQSMFDIILTDIANVESTDQEQATKMRTATETVLSALKERVGI